ncbi:MAG TPA: PIG-L deacetylase family protein, partial [Chloroflexota bacterium]|nr:PIG-L deacetylase family protein [Chloroflexota bacterium]
MLELEKRETIVPAVKQRRILAVYAHPDDAEIWAGGTLLAHRAAGDRLALCVLTHGEGPRANEAMSGAATLGAQLYHLPFQDRALRFEQATLDAVAEVLRAEQPHIILTHWDGDSHPDHLTTWRIAQSAIMLAEVERTLHALYWSDTYNGVGVGGFFAPDCLVDVTPHWEEKLAAIRQHQSQEPEYYVDMVE